MSGSTGAAGTAGSGGTAGSAGTAGSGGTAGDDPQDAGTSSSAEPFAPGSFSAAHKAEITKDCTETVQCQAQMGQELPERPMQTCVENSAAVLDERGEPIQTSFLMKFERCRDRVVCDYYACVTTPAQD